MAVLPNKPVVFLTLLAMAAFLGSLAGQLFLDTDENDLLTSVNGVRSSSLHSPDLGKAYAFDLVRNRFEPSSLCRLAVQQEPAVESAKYTLLNEWGVSYNNAIFAIGIDKDTTFLSNLVVDPVEKEWVFERTAWTQAPLIEFPETCRDQVSAKIHDPRYDVFVVEALLRESAVPADPQIILVSLDPVVLRCEGECPQIPARQEAGVASWTNLIRRAWPARIKVGWQLVRES